MGKQVLVSRTDVSNNAAANVCPIVNGSWASTSTANRLQNSPEMPVAGTLRNLRIKIDVAPGASKSRVYTLQKNAVDTALTLTLTGAGSGVGITEGTCTGVDVSVAVGDKITILHTPSGSPTSDAYTHISIEFEGTSAGDSIHMGSPSSGPSSSATQYIGMFDPSSWNATETSRRTVAAVAGNVTAFRVVANATPGVGVTWTFALYKNGVKQDGSGGTPDTRIAINSGASSGSWSGTLACSPGDLFSIQDVPPGGSLFTNFNFSIGFTATTDGESNFSSGAMGSAPSNSAVNYIHGNYSGVNWTATEANVQTPAGVSSFTLDQMRVWVAAALTGASVSWAFGTRVNSATPSGAPTVTLTVGQQAGTDGSNLATIVAGDTWDLRSSPTSASGNFPQTTWAWRQIVVVDNCDVAVSESITVSEFVQTSPIMRAVSDAITVAEYAFASNNSFIEAAEIISVQESVSLLYPTIHAKHAVSDAITVAESVTARLPQLALHVHDTIDVAEFVIRVGKTPLSKSRADFIHVAEFVKAQLYIGGGLWVRAFDTITVVENDFYLGYPPIPLGPGTPDLTKIAIGPNPGVPAAGLGDDYWIDGN